MKSAATSKMLPSVMSAAFSVVIGAEIFNTSDNAVDHDEFTPETIINPVFANAEGPGAV